MRFHIHPGWKQPEIPRWSCHCSIAEVVQVLIREKRPGKPRPPAYRLSGEEPTRCENRDSTKNVQTGGPALQPGQLESEDRTRPSRPSACGAARALAAGGSRMLHFQRGTSLSSDRKRDHEHGSCTVGSERDERLSFHAFARGHADHRSEEDRPLRTHQGGSLPSPGAARRARRRLGRR